MSQKPGLQRQAFTLVELLVVIGIIAILVAILLPTLSAAKRQANATRCMTQLREIGNALHLYGIDNNGWWPVMVHKATAGRPSNNPRLRSVPDRNDYWYQFLLKYFTKRENRKVDGGHLSDFQGTPLWGCTEVPKEQVIRATQTSQDFDSGYGFAPYAGYQPGNKFVNAGSEWAAIYEPNAGQWIEGKYYKVEDWKPAPSKIIVADSRAWTIEVRSFTPTAAEPVPRQMQGAITYANYFDQFDRYRHGKRPNSDGLFYSLQGGKVAFNALYCDGHVAVLNDIRQGYLGTRAKFPG